MERDNAKITFLKWLKLQREREDPVGDLASDVARDDRPKPTNTKVGWERFLFIAGAGTAVFEAFNQAWGEYEAL